ncbi:NIPSNAP family protein [Rhizobium sp. WYJ-E13]|uniref:NIPSNAP family protein n=1 Tax=unclassified Rhizobium TaxID=2613769 RepID=UPI0020A7D3FA|nr:NIPSNAP family protein [Rhizobium sp. WYJ-E13]
MKSTMPVTCEVRYRLDPGKRTEFEAYAEVWVQLIERYGGTHHGYFMPREKPEGAGLSFPGAGADGEGNIAIALFTFPDEETYLGYRASVAADPDSIAANARFGADPPFRSYERLFLRPLPRSE